MSDKHETFDELHEQLMTLIDRIDVAAEDLVDSEGYTHNCIRDAIHKLTRQRFDIMESFGYKLTAVENNQDAGNTH